ncbi:MAG TPA: hypothetical protein VGO57_09505 [Verrucomicrobiae bacterium]|jgi:hypothetical protein
MTFKENQIWITPEGKRIRLLKEVIQSGDSTWRAIVLPPATSRLLPHQFEQVVVMARYLRGCTLFEDSSRRLEAVK